MNGSPDRQAEVGDHCGNPQEVNVHLVDVAAAVFGAREDAGRGRLPETRINPGPWYTLVVYFLLCNSAPGPEIRLPSRISAGFQSGKPQNRPSGRPPD